MPINAPDFRDELVVKCPGNEANGSFRVEFDPHGTRAFALYHQNKTEIIVVYSIDCIPNQFGMLTKELGSHNWDGNEVYFTSWEIGAPNPTWYQCPAYPASPDHCWIRQWYSLEASPVIGMSLFWESDPWPPCNTEDVRETAIE